MINKFLGCDLWAGGPNNNNNNKILLQSITVVYTDGGSITIHALATLCTNVCPHSIQGIKVKDYIWAVAGTQGLSPFGSSPLRYSLVLDRPKQRLTEKTRI